MYLRSIIQSSCPTRICSSRSTRISHVMTLCCIACQIYSMSWDMNCINSIPSFITLYSLLVLGLFIGISRSLLVSSHTVLYTVHLFSVSHPNLSFYLCLSYPRSDFYILLNQEKFCLFPSSIYEYCVLYNHPIHPLFPIYSQIQQYISILFDELYKEIQYLSDLSVHSF